MTAPVRSAGAVEVALRPSQLGRAIEPSAETRKARSRTKRLRAQGGFGVCVFYFTADPPYVIQSGRAIP